MSIEKIIQESQDIEQILRQSGDNGYLFAASLFHLALQQPDDSNCKTAAKVYIDLMKSLTGKERVDCSNCNVLPWNLKKQAD